MKDFIETWGPFILSFVGLFASGGLLKVFFDRRFTDAQASLSSAQAGKSTVEGEVAKSADYRAWVQQANERAEKAENSAEASRQAAWKAEDAAARCKTQNAELSERLDTLEQWIRECARPGCPIRALVPPRTD